MILPAKFNRKATLCVKKPFSVESKNKLIGYLITNFESCFFEIYLDVLLNTKFLKSTLEDVIFFFKYTISFFLS